MGGEIAELVRATIMNNRIEITCFSLSLIKNLKHDSRHNVMFSGWCTALHRCKTQNGLIWMFCFACFFLSFRSFFEHTEAVIGNQPKLNSTRKWLSMNSKVRLVSFFYKTEIFTSDWVALLTNIPFSLGNRSTETPTR